jgi:hypothetical protein
MANDPPFATLNHFEGDSRTGESDFLRIGIKRTANINDFVGKYLCDLLGHRADVAQLGHVISLILHAPLEDAAITAALWPGDTEK